MAYIKIDQKNSIFNIQLARPEVRNAFHPDMIEELRKAFEQAGSTDCRAILLSGEGKSFCSGADLNWMKSMKDFSEQENQQDSEKLFAMFEAARNCPIPIIGKIHGHVMGGATGLVAICDIAAAIDGTKFCFSEVKIGLAPAVISPFVMRKMRRDLARQWMLTGQVFSASQAHVSGLVQFAGSETEVDKFIQNTLSHIFQSGPEAIRATKSLLNEVIDPMFNGLQEKTAQVIAKTRVSIEGQQGLQAFFDKTNPEWKKEFDA